MAKLSDENEALRNQIVQAHQRATTVQCGSPRHSDLQKLNAHTGGLGGGPQLCHIAMDDEDDLLDIHEPTQQQMQWLNTKYQRGKPGRTEFESADAIKEMQAQIRQLHAMLEAQILQRSEEQWSEEYECGYCGEEWGEEEEEEEGEEDKEV